MQLILPGKSDVLISQLAGQSLYRRFLKAGVQIHEYQPQILHAKLIIADDIVYVGSANLDPRSLDINYELMIRFDHAEYGGAGARDLCREPGALPARSRGKSGASRGRSGGASSSVGLLAAGAH